MSDHDNQAGVMCLSEVLSELRKRVESNGIILTEGRDIQLLEEKIQYCQKNLTVFLSTRGNVCPPDDVFYILGRAGDDNMPACLVAGRIGRFSGWTLRRYLDAYIPTVLTNDDGQPAELAKQQPRVWDTSPLRPAYLCELWTSERFRGKGIAQDMVKIAMIVSQLKWQPDLTWALMAHDDVVKRGLSLKYGWTHHVEDALRWARPPREIPAKVWYVGLTPSGLFDLAERHLPER